MRILNYDVFESYRKKAITEPKDINVGQSYYINCDKSVYCIFIDSLQTHKQHYDMLGLSTNNLSKEWAWAGYFYVEAEGAPLPSWINRDMLRYMSLHDRNVGDSYNPWMIFENLEDAKGAVEEIKFEYTPVADYYDDDVYYEDEV